ncbi:MAG: hypothetical protein V1853_03600 [bacterium]
MRRSTITVIVLVIVIGGAFLGWWFTKKETATNSNTTTNQISNTTVVTVPEQGAILVEKETLYRSTDVAITTALVETEFHGQTAAEGMQYVILFYETTNLAGAAGSISNWANDELALVSSDDTRYTLSEIKSEETADDAVKTGYLWYEGSDQASDFVLRFGTGEEIQELNIGF